MSLFLSALIPVLSPLLVLTYEEVPVVHWQYVSEEMVVFATPAEDVQLNDQFSYAEIFPWIYFMGIAISLTKLIIGFRRIIMIRIGSTIERKDGYSIAFTEFSHLPFSFWDTIYLSKKLPFREHFDQVIEHEKVHVSQRHSLDIILVELFHILFWFNPIFVLYKKALKNAHEYIADAFVCQKYSPDSYKELLIVGATCNVSMTLTHHFFQSEIKNRIKMITNHSKLRKNFWKFSLAVPVLIGLLFVFSTAISKQNLPKLNLFEYGIANDTLPKYGKMTLNGSTKDPAVQRIEIENGEATVFKKSGEIEKFDLKHQEELQDYEMRYGKLISPPPPPPAPPFFQLLDGETKVDQMPRFPGCEDISGAIYDKECCASGKMVSFLIPRLKYPKDARMLNAQGTAVVQFAVETDGSISEVEVIRDPGENLGQAAANMVLSMNEMNEKWIPAMKDGKKVKVKLTIPVIFKLEGEEVITNFEANSEYENHPNVMKIVGYTYESPVYKKVDQMPRFPGCEDMDGTNKEIEECAKMKLLEFVYSNLRYPESARTFHTEGTAVIQYIVETDGSITNVEIVKNPGDQTGEAAKKVVLAMNDMEEKWTPGIHEGKVVRVKYTLPVKFQLED